MKRLGVFAFIGIFLVSAVSILFNPGNVFAQNKAPFADAQVFLLNKFNGGDFVAKYNPEEKAYYAKNLEVLKGFASQKASTLSDSYSNEAFIMNVLNDFLDYLDKNKPAKTPELENVRVTMRDIANTLHTQASGADPNQPSLGMFGDGAEGGALGSAAQRQEAINATVDTVTKTGKLPEGNCVISFSGSFSILSCINDIIGWIIKNTLLQIAGFLLWITANMFNYSIQVGVLKFASWAPDSIYPIWLIIRQIVSLIIVFIGLYLGFMYILGKDEKFQKYIPWVIMFALFVNFSYPITRTLVDISNVVSLNIFTSAVGPGALEAGITDQNTAGGLITERLGLQGLISSSVSANSSKDGADMLKSVTGIPASLAAVCFVLYAAYIFLIVTGIFLMRTFVLVLLIVGSPILLVDSVFPLLGEKAKMLRKVFFEQLIVGPVFMIMFALTLKFLLIFSGSGAMGSTFSNISDATGASGNDTIKTFFNLIMMLVMLHVMIKVTKSTAGEIGNFASNAMGKVGGFGLGAGALAGGLIARQTIGRAASAASNSKWVTDNPNGVIGKSTRLLANTSYNIGNSSVVKGALGKAGINIGTGMGQSLGYDDAEKKRLEKRAGEYAAIGVHRKNVYNRDGTIKHRKGERNSSPEAEEERRKYLEKGGSVFATKYESNELREMTGQNEKSEKNKKFNEALAKYKELDEKHYEDNATGKAKKKADQEEIKNKQDKETQEKLTNYEQKLEKAEADKVASKEEREAAKKGNEALVSLVETLRTQKTTQQTPVAQQTTTPTATSQQVVSPHVVVQSSGNTIVTNSSGTPSTLPPTTSNTQTTPSTSSTPNSNQPLTSVDIDVTQPFNPVEQFGKASFAQRRMEAAQAAENNMVRDTTTKPSTSTHQTNSSAQESTKTSVSQPEEAPVI